MGDKATFGATPFTPAEDAQLLALYLCGVGWADIARRMTRASGPAVRARWEKLMDRELRTPALPTARQGRHAPKMRKCLSCGQMFLSAHAGNRLCCTRASDSPFEPMTCGGLGSGSPGESGARLHAVSAFAQERKARGE